MCEETVFWDLNYAMKYKSLVSENILKKVLKVRYESNAYDIYIYIYIMYIISQSSFLF